MTEGERAAIRKAAQVPLLWGRGDTSLGRVISQHILALVGEDDPDEVFVVLDKAEIEELIEARDYVPWCAMGPQPKLLKILWRRLLGVFS